MGVLSGCIHWLINGIIDDEDKFLFNLERGVDLAVISFVDFERLRIILSLSIGEVSNGDVDFVLEWRKEELNDDERINDDFDDFGRSI